MALTTARITPIRQDAYYNNRRSDPMEASQTFYMGQLVALNAGGFAVNPTATTGLRAIGVVGEQPFQIPAPSFTSSGTQGAQSIEVMGTPITAKFANSGSDAVVQDDVGNLCYIEDNQTVCHTGTGKSAAGQVLAIDDSTSPTGAGVWVIVGLPSIGNAGPQGPQGPQGAQGA